MYNISNAKKLLNIQFAGNINSSPFWCLQRHLNRFIMMSDELHFFKMQHALPLNFCFTIDLQPKQKKQIVKVIY